MKALTRFCVSALAVYLVSNMMPHVYMEDQTTAIVVALALAVLDVFLKPILTVLTIPITLVTFGFFLLCINAILILIADKLVDGFHVDGFWWALLFSLVLSFVTGIINQFLGLNPARVTRNEEFRD